MCQWFGTMFLLVSPSPHLQLQALETLNRRDSLQPTVPGIQPGLVQSSFKVVEEKLKCRASTKKTRCDSQFQKKGAPLETLQHHRKQASFLQTAAGAIGRSPRVCIACAGLLVHQLLQVRLPTKPEALSISAWHRCVWDKKKKRMQSGHPSLHAIVQSDLGLRLRKFTHFCTKQCIGRLTDVGSAAEPRRCPSTLPQVVVGCSEPAGQAQASCKKTWAA